MGGEDRGGGKKRALTLYFHVRRFLYNGATRDTRCSESINFNPKSQQ
jgi:hypothetical protein